MLSYPLLFTGGDGSGGSRRRAYKKARSDEPTDEIEEELQPSEPSKS